MLLEQIKEQLNGLFSDYKISLIDDNVIVINKHGKKIKSIKYQNRAEKYILYNNKKKLEVKVIELYSILTGVEYNSKNHKFDNICKICGLDYPTNEMRAGRICYLCLEEEAKKWKRNRLKTS